LKKYLSVFTAVATSLVALEGDARACGGCFHPPAENPTVVTDHRMIFSISKTQSTLYDQIRYTGSPASFAWVLPYAGDVEIGLSADYLFSVLDGQTQTSIVGTACPPPPSCGSSGAIAGNASSSSGGSGVVVLDHEVVGPYETVKLSATDANALEEWLRTNGYALPDAVKPVVAAYQAEHFDFLALKLAPGQGVQDMRPVRVTTKGSNVALPLRMVAAGTGATVGITLWVVGEGRYQPQNFDSYYIAAEDLTWNPIASSSDYAAIRDRKNTAGDHRVWEIESSETMAPSAFERALGYHQEYVYSGAGAWEDVTSDAGAVTKTAAASRDEDLDVLFGASPPDEVRITRLRADLAHAALDQDLVLRAAADQAVLPRMRVVTKSSPPLECPKSPPSPCSDYGLDGTNGDAGVRVTTVGGGDGGCSTSSGSTPWAWLGAGVAAMLSVLARRRRR
jgi:hypothetical protein